MRAIVLGPFALLMLILSGCNTQVISGEAAERLRHPYPYGARWIKEGMTRESRLNDWVACGGGVNLSNGFRTNIHGELMRQYLDDMENHRKKLSSCIQAKGYTFKYFPRPGLSDECTPEICLYP
jgi:hypothetical protein